MGAPAFAHAGAADVPLRIDGTEAQFRGPHAPWSVACSPMHRGLACVVVGRRSRG